MKYQKLYKDNPFSEGEGFWKDPDEELETVEQMLTYGGSFVKRIAEAYQHADTVNKLKLINAFDYFEEYKNR